jgi:hypothetical protein
VDIVIRFVSPPAPPPPDLLRMFRREGLASLIAGDMS